MARFNRRTWFFPCSDLQIGSASPRPPVKSAFPDSRLVLFPGLGGDARMYGELAARVGPIVVPPWLPPELSSNGSDLRGYAQRYVDQRLVRPGDWLGGSSFGGMLAQEIAGLIPVRGLLLMGTCRSAAGVSFGLRQLAPLMKVVPMPDHGAHVLAWPLALKFGVTRPAHRQLLAALIDDADPRFLRWASQVAAAWPGIKEPGTKALSLPLFQIHGSRDHLMPVERSGAETIVHGAGHLLALTHAPQVATWMLHARKATD